MQKRIKRYLEIREFYSNFHRLKPPPPPFFKGGIDLTENSKKGGMEKLLKGRGILRREDSVGKGRMLLVWILFLAGVWEM